MTKPPFPSAGNNSAGRPKRNSARVLMVDDDARLCDLVTEFLAVHGFTLVCLPNADALAAYVRCSPPDIILLDIMMPGDDGLTALRKLRRESPVPVIMLTAKGDDADRIAGLESGADDYLAKPFNPRELLARLKALLRRTRGDIIPCPGHGSTATPTMLLRAGAFVLDRRLQTLSRGPACLPLTTTEFNMLEALMGRPGNVLARETLHALALGDPLSLTGRSADVHISRIRAMLRRLGEEEPVIETVRGQGYRWRDA